MDTTTQISSLCSSQHSIPLNVSESLASSPPAGSLDAVLPVAADGISATLPDATGSSPVATVCVTQSMIANGSSWKHPFSGVSADLRARLLNRLWIADWLDGFRDKRSVSALVFIFFCNNLPALTFAMLLSDRTGGNLGAVEVVLAMAIAGTAFALLAGQPLVIVGVTGPVSILCATLYDLSVRFGIPFFGWLFWTCAWTCLFHICLSAVSASRAFPNYVTAFSEDCFGFLISSIYVVEGLRGLVEMFVDAGGGTGSGGGAALASPLLSLLFGLGTAVIARYFAAARSWHVFARGFRAFVADYGPTLTLVVVAALQFLPRLADVPLPHLRVPSAFAPSVNRPWIDADAIAGTPGWAIAAALLPALVLTALLYFDHNVSALLSQRREFGLKKPPSFDWDFMLLGLLVLVCGMLGLPPPYGLLPQAPLHTRALAKIKEVKDGPLTREVWIRVCETRVSALGQALLTFALLSKPLLAALGALPRAVLLGQLLYLGLAGFQGNALAERLRFLAFDTASRQAVVAPYANVSYAACAGFSLVQLAFVVITFAITFTPAGIIFPALIVLLVPFRLLAMPRIFAPAVLEALDPRLR